MGKKKVILTLRSGKSGLKAQGIRDLWGGEAGGLAGFMDRGSWGVCGEFSIVGVGDQSRLGERAMVQGEQGRRSLVLALQQTLHQGTQAPESLCGAVADRLGQAILHTLQQRTPSAPSLELEKRAIALGLARVDDIIRYYHLGSHQGRLALHGELQGHLYRAWLQAGAVHPHPWPGDWVEDFLQSFYGEALEAWRRDHHLPATTRPRTLLELAEFMAFVQAYGQRIHPAPSGRGYAWVVLRAWQYLKAHPPQDWPALVTAFGSDLTETLASDLAALPAPAPPELALTQLRNRVVETFLAYLLERHQEDCADYFTLRLLDTPLDTIEAILDLTPRQRGYLHQRLQYHLARFALSHHWELVHTWLEADLSENLGMTPGQWAQFQAQLSDRQRQRLLYKQKGLSDLEIAQKMEESLVQTRNQWSTLLGQAWAWRNGSP